MTKRIPLTKGQTAMIDDDDAALVGRYTWHAQERSVDHGHFYAATRIKDPSGALRPGTKATTRQKTLQMHRVIFGKMPSGTTEIDHINGDGLDNRKANLRAVTHQQNMCNQRTRKGASSKHKGVSRRKQDGRWYARVSENGTQEYVGLYKTEAEALHAQRAHIAARGLR